jgi:HlyD family secretion protein
MKKKIVSSIIVLVAILAFIGYTFVVIFEEKPVVLQGEIEAKQLSVASKLPGRVDEIAVKRGDMIDVNEFVFSIDSPEVNAKMAEAQAAYDAAMAQNRKAQNGAQHEDITAAYSVFVKAEAAMKFAEKTCQRIQNLYDKGVVAEQQLDEAQTKLRAAQENAKAAKATWNKARKGAREEDKAAAQAVVARADAAIEQVQAYLDETRINSIGRGEVSSVNVEEGELVPTGFPVVSIIDLDNIWLTMYIREDYLSHFKMGEVVKAKVPALGDKSFDFTVSYISAAADFARWNATKTSGEFDLKSFEIELRPVSKIEGLRPGMTAVVTLNIVE